MKQKVILLIFLIMLISLSVFVSASITSPGTYNIKPGEIISFSGASVKVYQIKLDDNDVSWNVNFNKPMVYFIGGVGTKIHVGESAGVLPNTVAREAIIGIKVNSIDIENQIASATFVDVRGLGNAGLSIPDSYFLDESNMENIEESLEGEGELDNNLDVSISLWQKFLNWFKRIF